MIALSAAQYGHGSGDRFRIERERIVNQIRSVNLPAELCERAEKKFGSNFGDVAQLLEYVLRELLRDDAAHADDGERRLIEQRLRDLGYL